MQHSESERIWREDQRKWGWVLPDPAPLWKRLPVIRHIRAMRAAFHVHRHQQFWASLGQIPNPYDNWVLYAINRGWV